jgi:hypothetical protein
MLIGEPLPFVKEYVEELNRVLGEIKPGQELSGLQRKWLTFCIMGIIVTNSVCWAKFERAGLKQYSIAAISWMFRQAKIPWESLLYISVRLIVRKYGISSGELISDDSDRQRSKVTKRIFAVHKLKDKQSGGYIMGQCIVLLLLVTEIITIPVGFSFYQPDPAWQAWELQEQELKEQGVPKKSDLQNLREILSTRRKRRSCLRSCSSSNSLILTYA